MSDGYQRTIDRLILRRAAITAIAKGKSDAAQSFRLPSGRYSIGVDVHNEVATWRAVQWNDDGSGTVIDYGQFKVPAPDR